ncbi:MAG: radical SAM protein [Elusimicrobia bacterium]|nr:radical SAM protein [Elusimicrobiota bacterium]
MAELAYLQVSRVCNQSCVFCSNPANGRTIEWSEAVRLVDSFAAERAAGVILTGGEPTLFEDLAKLVAYCRKKGLVPRMVTNGQKTADLAYLKSLSDAGLEHLHVSLHSHRAEVQSAISQNPDSLPNITRTLENAGELGVRVDINTVINSKNAGHLSLLVRWLTERFPFIVHVVWNNLDPLMNRAALNPEIVPKLRAFEVELHLAMRHLHAGGRTFRVERVPLCYMSDFPHRSTETRKFVKEEGRHIYFLDEKGLRVQGKASWTYGKSERCAACGLDPLCAGLYQLGVYYAADELCPVFTDPAKVVAAVLKDGDVQSLPGPRKAGGAP